MKTFFAVAAFLLLTTSLMASDESTMNYVTTKGQTYFGEKIKMGFAHTQIINAGESSIKVDNADVDAYMKDGKLYERLPIVCDGKVKEKVFMEYVTTRSGLRLYKYCHSDEYCSLFESTYDKASMKACYFVFRDGEFYLKIDAKNAQSSLPFFGIEVRE